MYLMRHDEVISKVGAVLGILSDAKLLPLLTSLIESGCDPLALMQILKNARRIAASNPTNSYYIFYGYNKSKSQLVSRL
jgi:hypothetical protein